MVHPEEKAESKKMQALIASLGERMGLRIWVPKADRGRVMEFWKPADGTLLDILPLNYDETTIRTIEQIDVIWLHHRSIVRAFEVEHTTSVHSGILRMADLMALQPNIDIKAHIVAPILGGTRSFRNFQGRCSPCLKRVHSRIRAPTYPQRSYRVVWSKHLAGC